MKTVSMASAGGRSLLARGRALNIFSCSVAIETPTRKIILFSSSILLRIRWNICLRVTLQTKFVNCYNVSVHIITYCSMDGWAEALTLGGKSAFLVCVDAQDHFASCWSPIFIHSSFEKVYPAFFCRKEGMHPGSAKRWEMEVISFWIQYSYTER